MSQPNLDYCHSSLATERCKESFRKPEQSCADEPPFGDGCFQLVTLLNVVIAGAAYVLHYESFRMTAGVMDHWCRRPETFANLSVKQWKELAIPVDKQGAYSRCTVREPPYSIAISRVVPCTSLEFDLSKYRNNAVSEWVLVCDRAWLISLARLVYAAACIFPTPLVSRLADRVGRKVVVFVTIPVVLIAGVASSLPNDFHFFVAVRAVVSAATSCTMVPLFAILWEVCPPRKTPIYCIVFIVITMVVGDSTVSIAEQLKAGWATVQLVLMVPTFLLVGLYFTVEESPSWLVATGRVGEAERISQRLAKLNGVPSSRCRELFALQTRAHVRDAAETLKQSDPCNARLRSHSILVFYIWRAVSYAQDSYIPTDGIPVRVLVKVIAAVTSLSACVLFTHLVHHYGPKRTVVVSGLGFSASLAALTAMPLEEDTLLLDLLVIVMKTTGYITFSNFGVLAIQLYPVTAHCTAMAIALISSRVGDTSAQMSTVLTGPRWHLGNGLTFAAVTSALFVIASEHLPDESATGASGMPDHMRSTPGEDLKRVFQETLKPLRKKPAKHGENKTRRKQSTNLLQY
ncbi:beta-alanine transporter-like [Dermacentor albipictus]|uniref:beta-alanine transporter-like n=1 Tax=Dermacentor albipictus TaxID=60249 RepID=UPI0038FCCED5